tara:strand:- start:13226 stop:20032 length:6807 start_codon:yes stop_codon:yes gene_type:complete
LRPAEYSALGAIAWHNGSLVINGDPAVEDGDWVTFAAAPTDALTVAMAVEYLMAAIVVAAVGSYIVKRLMPKESPVEDNLGGSTYSYYGFRNAYRAEGDAIPVVYGKMRVAPPCINQSVTGQHVFNPESGPAGIQIGISEQLNSMYAVSHGPILGFGSLQGDVFTEAAFDTLVSLQGNIGERIGFQINGLDGKHLPTNFEWRTGGMTQEPMGGLIGASSLPVTDPGSAYDLAFKITVGSLGDPSDPGIGETHFPFGVYTYGSTDTIIESNPTQFLSLQMTSKGDVCDVQMLWGGGMFSGGAEGSYSDQSALIRIQYWKTDSAGTATSDVILLPAFTVTAAVPSPFSVDMPFTLFDPATYSPPDPQSYALIRSPSTFDNYIYNDDGDGMVKLRPGTVGNDPDVKFTLACFASLISIPDSRNLWLMSWTNKQSDIGDMDDYSDGAGNLDSPKGWSTNTIFFGVRLYVDGNGSLGPDFNGSGGATGNVFVIVTAYANYGTILGEEYGGFWWRTRYPIGNTALDASSWPVDGYGIDCPPLKHITIAYDGTGYDSPVGVGEFRCYIDGLQVEFEPGERGGAMTTPDHQYDGTVRGWLWQGDDIFSTLSPGLHMPPEFRVSNTPGQGALQIGKLALASGSHVRAQESRGTIQQYLFYNTLIGGGWTNTPDTVQAWAYQAANLTNVYGQRTYDIRSLEGDPRLRICCPFDLQDFVGSGAAGVYQNFALDDPYTTSLPDGALWVEDLGVVSSYPGTVVYDEAGTPTIGYYYIEVFKEAPTFDGTDTRDIATVDSVTTWATQEYNYPLVAYLATSLSANEQINANAPNITVICHGKKVLIWDGGSEGTPTFTEAWSNNPAWVALDMLTNVDYGMGSIFVPDGTYENINLPAFFEWAQFCDEGVPDAFGTLDVFSLSTSYIDISIPPKVTLRFGMLDTSGNTQAVPETWRPELFQSITAVTAAGFSNGWKTSDDVINGLNNASNMLLVDSMEFKHDEAGFHGWYDYLEVVCIWNRRETDGTPIWPEGGHTSSYHADEYGLATLCTAGQYERRCEFDGVFDQKERTAWDALIDIMQTGRAMPAKAGRKVFPVWDRPRDPIGLFTQANVIEGSLELSFVSPDLQPNSIETEILDANHGYERRSILIDHDSIQNPAVFGQVRKERSTRLGITRRSQALRDAYYRLNRYNLQRRQFKFRVGPDALHILPGDRVLLAHDVPQYGYSGRLASDVEVSNIHPGATDMVDSWNQHGGDCAITIWSLLVSDATAVPSAFSEYSNTALGYAPPTASDGTYYYPAGQLGASGYNALTASGVGQHVAVADGLYPWEGNEGVPFSPLDRIAATNQKKEFSCYVRQPTYGASEGVLLNVYRYIDRQGLYLKISHSVLFTWNGAGALVHDSTIGGACTSYTIDQDGDWYRPTIFYDNGDTANGGGGAAAVGDYIQARLCYSIAPGHTTWFSSPSGRNNNLLQFGDPSNLDGLLQGSTTLAWTKANDGAGSNSIANSTTSAPPFYPSDTGAEAGKRGYVLNLKNDQPANQSNPCIRQSITLPTGWPGGGGAGDMADEAICATFFLRVAADNAAALSSVEAYLWMSTDGVLNSALFLPGWFSNTSNQVRYQIKDFDSTPTITYSDVEPGAAAQTNLSATIAAVKQTSTTDDANWFQVDVAWKTDTDFPTLYVLAGMRGDSGGTSSVDFWGLRVHGAGGTGASTDYVQKAPHRGTLLWGPLYQPNSDGSTVSPWSQGMALQLDRDVDITTATNYEVYLRSSFSLDSVTGSDVTTRVAVADSEIPSSGTVTKAARTDLDVAASVGMVPVAGDVYSFGKVDASVEDIVVTDININPETLEREVRGVEYVEAIYDDTAFGTMGDLTVSDLPPPGAGGENSQYGFGGGGPRGNAFTVTARSAPFRTQNAAAQAAIMIALHPPRGVMPYKEVRLWISSLSSGVPSSPRYVAALPASVQTYRYDDMDLDPAVTYRVYAQRVGWRGTGSPIASSPYTDVTPTITPRLPSAPTLGIEADGFSQMYQVASAQDARVNAIEGRVGGWVISTPAFTVDPDNTEFTSRGIAIGALNAAGQTNFPVVARARLASGKFGRATTVTTTSSFADARSTSTKIAEDNYAAFLTIPSDLQVSSGVLQWDESVPSTATGPVYVEMLEFDLTAAARSIPTASIEGYQIRPETLGDLFFTLGSETGRSWSLEGPMDDGGAVADNAQVKVEWRWTSGSDVTLESYVPFESQEVYFRKCQFRLVWTRPTAAYQVRLTRFTARVYSPPLFEPSDVDGGTF